MSDVTQLLDAAASGDRRAAAELLPLVYGELRKLAAARMAAESPGNTLQPTALVHEAYLRLVGGGQERSEVRSQRSDEDNQSQKLRLPISDLRPPAPAFDTRGHFFAAAAEAMRRILVEAARRKDSLKHGGGHGRADFELAEVAGPQRPEELLAVDEALAGLAEPDAQAAELVKLRYFVGLSVPEAAQVLKISTRSAERLWTFARAWLRRKIEGPSN